jgi:hypothetical protein
VVFSISFISGIKIFSSSSILKFVLFFILSFDNNFQNKIQNTNIQAKNISIE